MERVGQREGYMVSMLPLGFGGGEVAYRASVRLDILICSA